MKFFKHFYTGINAYFKAIDFVFRQKLWYYFIIPLGLSLLLYFAGNALLGNLYAYDYGNPLTIRELIWDLIIMLLMQTLIFISIELRKYIVLILLSPLIARLSLITEELLTGNTYKFTWERYMNDMKRAIRIIFGNLVIQYGISLIWIVIALIFSGLREYTPGVLLAIGFYFYGFGMIDYVNERRRLNIDQSVSFVRRHSGFAIAIGCVFSLLFLIPFEIGVTFAPVLAIVAATIGMNEIVDLKKNKFATKQA